MTQGRRWQLLGAGKLAEVLSRGPHALKLYRIGGKQQVFHEAGILAVLETLDVPAPRVETAGRFDGCWGLLMSRVSGRTFGDAVTEAPGEVPRICRRWSGCTAGSIVSGPGLGSLKRRLRARVAAASDLGKAAAGACWSGLPAAGWGRLCHGDFHPYNVLGEPGEAVVVDWLDATGGAPAADLCRSYLLISHHAKDLAQAYVDAYLAADGELTEEAVFAWLPVLAAARLAENVPEETERLLALAEAG